MMYKIGKTIVVLVILSFFWALWYSNKYGCINTSVVNGIFSNCRYDVEGR